THTSRVPVRQRASWSDGMSPNSFAPTHLTRHVDQPASRGHRGPRRAPSQPGTGCWPSLALSAHGVAAVALKLVDGNEPKLRIDEPVEANTKRRILEQFVDAIPDLVGMPDREDLDRDEGRRGGDLRAAGRNR